MHSRISVLLQPRHSFVTRFATATFAATAMTTLAGIATGIIAARVLGPQGRGELAALTL